MNDIWFYTQRFASHCFLLFVIGCVTWMGTSSQMGSEMGFQTWFGFAIHRV